MAGFKKCGIYPFNREAITLQKSDSSNTEDTSNDGNPDDVSGMCNESQSSFFNAEQHALFTKRFEEGYNIFTDQDYVVWIKLHHPEFDLVSILDCLDVSPLQELNSLSG